MLRFDLYFKVLVNIKSNSLCIVWPILVLSQIHPFFNIYLQIFVFCLNLVYILFLLLSDAISTNQTLKIKLLIPINITFHLFGFIYSVQKLVVSTYNLTTFLFIPSEYLSYSFSLGKLLQPNLNLLFFFHHFQLQPPIYTVLNITQCYMQEILRVCIHSHYDLISL